MKWTFAKRPKILGEHDGLEKEQLVIFIFIK